jgi:selenocysteine lyase/cysteine desulfurase
VHVLTTTGEFHSFARQTRRLEETGRLEVTRVPVEPYDTFRARFAAALRAPQDLVFLSHVFFDSSFVVEGLDELLAGVPAEAVVAVDGYHAFMAIPVALGPLGDRIFYTAGGYKYVQAGEGACFLTLPAGCTLRPVYTGWYSDFGRLSGAQGEAVGYGADAMRFWGSTFDASGLYRFNAVMRWLRELGITAREIHIHVATLERRFLAGLGDMPLARLPLSRLTPPAGEPRGNFLTFDLDDAESVEQRLAAAAILVDRRGRRVRFGFGVYHDEAFVDALLARLRRALA